MSVFGFIFKGSLRRTFLVSLVLLYVVTVGAAVGVFVRNVTAVADRYVERFARSQNLMERNRILAIVDRDATLSLKLADDPFIQSWMKDERDPELRERAIRQLESYRDHFRDATYFVGVADTLSYYVHTPGTESMSHTVLDPDAPYDRWFFETLRSDREFWINVDFNVLLGEIRVWINSLVRDGDGALLGAAGTGMDLSDFLGALVEHDDPGLSTIIVNRQGEILAHRDRAIIEHNANVDRNEDRITLDTLVDSGEHRETLQRVLAILPEDPEHPASVRTATLQFDGEPYVAAIGYIPELQWYNLVLVDAGRIMGVGSFLPLIQVSIVALLTVLVVVALLLNRLVLRPLQQLSHAANLVAKGDYSVQLDPVGDNEIARLSASFTSMTGEIREYTTRLEEMVDERTRELQASQERVMESIRYGQLIQQSIMPARKELEEHLRSWFVFHRPLHTVGGDFPYFRPMHDGFCIAAVDCTGHGVPGAFMTMLVSTVLNRVVDTSGPEDDPGDMLLRTHHYVQDGLRAAADRQHLENGMDIALCRFRRSKNVLEFSGTGLPLVYHRDGSMHRVDGARTHLGYLSTERNPDIPVHSVDVTASSRHFLFSDGILDLPGEDTGFGLGTGKLTEILRELVEKRDDLGEDYLIQELERYHGTASPRDDMLLLSFAPILREEGT